jgi:Protein of unknown function (DUF4232)
MTPEERLAHLLDEDRWNDPGFMGRPVERRRRPRAFVGVLTAVVAGALIGVLVTIGIGPLRSTLRPGDASEGPTSALSPAPTGTPTTSSQPALRFTQSAGIDPVVGKKLSSAALAANAPLAFWNAGRTALTFVLWGSSCFEKPLQLRVVSANSLYVKFGPVDSGSTAICADYLAPESTVFTVPAGLNTSGSVTAEVDSKASGQHSVSVIDYADLSDPSTAATCSLFAMGARVTSSDGAMGTSYEDLVLTNTAHHACTLEGVPTIVFRQESTLGPGGDPEGQAVGGPATYSRWETPGPVVLAGDGGTAVVRLSLAQAANFEAAQCKPEVPVGVRIGFRGATGTTFARWPAQVCANASLNQFRASDVLAERTTKGIGWQDGKP